MYEQYSDGICERCREITNKVKLEEWNLANPDYSDDRDKEFSTYSYQPIEMRKEIRERYKVYLAEKRARGYWAWEYPQRKVVTITADCNGDDMTLCAEHLTEYYNVLIGHLKD